MHTLRARLDDADLQACRGGLTISRETARHRCLDGHEAIRAARVGGHYAAQRTLQGARGLAEDRTLQGTRGLVEHRAAHRCSVLRRRRGKQKVGASERSEEHDAGLDGSAKTSGMQCG
ncbi:hypothetical protein PMIN06_000262 [Paraphaeosphaeria minitans]